MADPTFEQLQKNIESDAVQSAKKAIDYLENDMLSHLEEVMGPQLKKWKQRGFVPVYENPTRILIERSAKTYKTPPKRVVTVNGEASEGLTETYADLLKDTNLDFISQDLDARSRLTTASMLLVQVDNDTGIVNLSVLSRDNSAVKFDRITGEIVGLMYTAGMIGMSGGQIFHYWTPTEIRDFEDEQQIGSTMPNPYGIVPVAILHDKRPSLNLWKYKTWEQLIQLSDGLNLFNTEALFNSRYAMVGSPVTNMTIPEGMVTGIDAPMQLDGGGAVEAPFFEFSSPTANVTEFMSWFKPFRESVADEWGVNLNIAGSGSADSGFKLIVEEFENIELRQTRIQSAKVYEKDLYQIFAIMGLVHTDWGLSTDAECLADFDEPSLPVNKAEEWLIASQQIALGLLSPEEYWKRNDPDLTVEDLANKRRAYDAARGLAATVPTFEA